MHEPRRIGIQKHVELTPYRILNRRELLLSGAALAMSFGGCRADSRAEIKQDTTSKQLASKPTSISQKRLKKLSSDECAVVPRSSWTQREVGANADPMRGVKRLTVHHTGEHLSASGLSDQAVMRKIERYHVEQLGWAAIGYHFLIGRNGVIFEGRPLAWRGAHCGGANNQHNVGVTIIGYWEDRLPSAQQLSSLEKFLDQLREKHGIPMHECYGHRDWKPTLCPGSALYAWLETYRNG